MWGCSRCGEADAGGRGGGVCDGGRLCVCGGVRGLVDVTHVVVVARGGSGAAGAVAAAMWCM